MTKARKTTLEERIAMARECIESGRNYGEIANKYKVSYQQVYNWTNKFAEQGEDGLEDRRGQRTAQQAPRTVEEELRVRIAQGLFLLLSATATIMFWFLILWTQRLRPILMHILCFTVTEAFSTPTEPSITS